MELEATKVAVATLQAQATAIVAGQTDSDSTLLQAMRRIAEAMLPDFCFDTPQEEELRLSMVRNAPDRLLPTLLRPLWKRTVQELMASRNDTRVFW